MAGDWMKIELELPDKPEVHAIAGSLSLDPDAVVGKLIRVWQWFDKHTKDGNAFGVTFSLIDRITSVTGFGEAMMFAGWLEQNDKHLTMPKFDRHTSSSAKSRATTKVRVKKHRAKECNAVTVTEPLPEKRREEKIEDIKPTSKKSAISIQTFLDNCKREGIERIPKDDSVFDFAENNKIPIDMVRVCWQQFVRTHRENGKRQSDWRKTFRNCVRGNWYKLWFIEADGMVKETSQYRALKNDLGDAHAE